jgi:hypothetical protein
MTTSNKIQTIAANLRGLIAVDMLKLNCSAEEAARFQFNQLVNKIGRAHV